MENSSLKTPIKNYKIINNLKNYDMQKNILCLDLGLISYNHAYSLQEKIFELIKLKDNPGVILLLEHYPVITIGSNRNTNNLLTSREKLQQQGIELIQSNRGGDITLHSPGQIVCYTLLNLAQIKRDLSLFVYNLEQVIIDVLANYNIQGTRIHKHRGIFVDNSKIASIGLRVRKWATLHGFSLNVNNDLKYFDNITACGLKDYPQTSIKKILKKAIPIHDVKEQILDNFSSIFKIPVIKII